MPPPGGAVEWTRDRARARRFATAVEALEFWRQEVGPVRPDGKPNRPLTAFTVEVARL